MNLCKHHTLYFCFFLLSHFTLASLCAKTIELKKNADSILVESKDDWTLGKELFGIPFIFFSPEENGQRSNISFAHTGATLELDVTAISSSQNIFNNDKKVWASSVGADIISFIPYETQNNKHGHKVHTIGLNFSHQKKTYQEKSYYIECHGRIIFSKALRLQENGSHDKVFQELISSLDCPRGIN